MSRQLIKVKEWYDTFAPGLEMQPIPEEATILGPLEPLSPYGLQYRVQIQDGSSFPRHQSGPGATIAITDGARVVMKQDFRPESNSYIIKCAGGFAGDNKCAAADMVRVFQDLPNQRTVCVGSHSHPSLYPFFQRLLAREYNGWDLGERVILFVIRPIGNPNIRICSILGYLPISANEFDAHKWPMVANNMSEVVGMFQTYQLGDQNTDLLLRELISRNILRE